MTSAVLFHITTNLAGHLRQLGLRVAEHANELVVWCPACTERRTYTRTANGWEGAAFLHDDGCEHFRAAQHRVEVGR